MAIILRRQLFDEEKQRVLKTHGRICFATGHTIAEGEPVHFDHIKAFSSGGATETGNIAPMCEKHNPDKKSRRRQGIGQSRQPSQRIWRGRINLWGGHDERKTS